MENSGYKILIVDDVPKNIQVVGNILQEYDFDIYFANNGQNAIKQIQNNTFDLILLDVMMPEMDGFEVCQRIKQMEHTKDTPIIFLTAKTDMESTIKGFELGAVDYVTKPFNAKELLARIKTHISLREARYNLVKKNQEIEKQKNELEQAYEKLKVSEDILKGLNATKDKFFSIVAHDLKNPFSTLIGFTEVLVKNSDHLAEDRLKQIYQIINNSAQLGYNLLENLLEWSRSQTGRIEVSPDTFDFKEVSSENTILLHTAAQKKNIQLIDNIADNTLVYADKNMIKTVVRNLMTNALKFTNFEGQITIYATTFDHEIEFVIQDSGIGISEEDQHKLFRIDVNQSTIGTSKEKGTGLGLILCKEFVEKNEGKICVESTVGKGSKFKFTLPLKP